MTKLTTEQQTTTELEQHIINCAKEQIDKIKERLLKIRTNCHYIQIPFTCDSMIDLITFDRHLNKFTQISYIYGIGKGLVIDNDSHEGLFDDSETRYIDLTNIKLC